MQASGKSTLRNERNAFSRKATPLFDVVDRNRDGRLDRVEFARW
jgi:hypothetical protein